MINIAKKVDIMISISSLGIMGAMISNDIRLGQTYSNLSKEISFLGKSPIKMTRDVNNDGLPDYIYYDGAIARQLHNGRYVIEHYK